MPRKRKTHKIRRKRSIFSYRFFWFGLLAIIISAGLFYLIVFSTWFQVIEIKITGNEKVAEHVSERSERNVEGERKALLAQAIQELIQPQIEQQIGFWGTRSIFLANLNKASKTILEKFPLISEVEIKRDFPNTLVITIEERDPVAIFHYKEQNFFIDKKGIIFSYIEEENKPHRLLKIESLILIEELKFGKHEVFPCDTSEALAERSVKGKHEVFLADTSLTAFACVLGKRILEKELVSKILEIEQQTKEINIPIIKVLIVSDRRLNVKTLEGWEIYFNLKDDISTQVFHLNLVLDEKIPPEKRKNLKYIDLRFDRVFFR